MVSLELLELDLLASSLIQFQDDSRKEAHVGMLYSKQHMLESGQYICFSSTLLLEFYFPST